MNTFIFILNLIILLVTLASPFLVLYAIALVRKKEYYLHLKIQKITFYFCLLSVIVLEMQIRLLGGSGSLSAHSPYVHQHFYHVILAAHITGAVLTYLFWIVLIYLSNWKYKRKKTLPGKFTKIHRPLGYILFGGLIYTAVSALIVFTLTFVL